MSIALHKIAYSAEEMIAELPGFRNYDCSSDPAPEKRELHHMRRFFEEGLHRQADVSGLLSPSFSLKTRLGAEHLLRHIEAKPGYDVYFVNPYPLGAYLSFNVWEHGEVYHPGLAERANLLFAEAGLDIDVSRLGRNNLTTALYCNYWVGSAAFWERFMAFVIPLMDAADALSGDKRALFFEDARYQVKTSFYPFVFERMFSTFLMLTPDIKKQALIYDREVIRRLFCCNPIKRTLYDEWGPMIDAWDRVGEYSADQRDLFRTLCKLEFYSKSF